MPDPALQLRLPQPPLIVGIAGCSGSGKTTLARELTAQLDASLLILDLYYRDLAHLPPDERAIQNFDHPDSLESTLLTRHIEDLAACRPIHAPVYDFATHTRVPAASHLIEPRPILFVEGILALHFPELRRHYDLSFFVDAPHDVCLMRRIHRDVGERARTEASVRKQFDDFTRPMADRFVLPSAAHATLTVAGTESLDWSVEQVLSALHRLERDHPRR